MFWSENVPRFYWSAYGHLKTSVHISPLNATPLIKSGEPTMVSVEARYYVLINIDRVAKGY